MEAMICFAVGDDSVVICFAVGDNYVIRGRELSCGDIRFTAGNDCGNNMICVKERFGWDNSIRGRERRLGFHDSW